MPFDFIDSLAAVGASSPEEYEKSAKAGRNEKNKSDLDSENYTKGVTGALQDLRTTDDQIYKLMKGADSDAKRMAFQYAFQKRQQMVEFMTNILKSLSDTARAIIANMRP